MTHTPGPWVIFHTGSINMIVPAMREGMIADLIDNEANARLISAAPELLSACKAMLEWIDQRPQTHPYDAWKAASNAVAKAEGNAS